MDIREKIIGINRLNPFPSVSLEILSGVHDEKTAKQKIIKLIETDPILTSKILFTANSPFYGMRWSIASIQQAILVLGTEEVNRLVLTYKMKQAIFSLEPKQNEYLNRVWKHSVATAVICRMIKQYIHFHSDGEEFTSGLLHDLGKIVIAQYFSNELDASLHLIANSEMTDVDAEIQILTIAHTEIGFELGKKWGLPPLLNEAMQFHHNTEKASINPVVTSIVRFADLLSERWEYGIGERSIHVPLDEEPCWKLLQQKFPDLNTMHAGDFDDALHSLFETSKEFMGMFT